MSPTFRRYLTYARPYWRLIAGATFCGVLKFTLALMLPASLGLVTRYVMLDDLPPAQKVVRLAIMLGLLALTLLLRTPITYLRSYLAARACQSAAMDLRRDLFRHIQHLSLAYHHRQKTGNITARLITDMNDAGGILDQGIVAVGMDIIFMTGVVVFLFALDWRLASVSLATLPLYAIVYHRLNPRLRDASSRVQAEMEEMSGEVTEKLNGLHVVKAFVREDSEEAGFVVRLQRHYQKVLARVRVRVTLMSTAEFLQSFGPVVVVGFGGYRAVQDPAFLPQLIVFYGFIQHLYLPARRLADCSAIIQEKLAALDRVFEVLDAVPDIQDAPGAVVLPRVEGRVTLEDVHFSYDNHVPVLKGVTFEVEPGRAIALVGRSGAGKSTLVNLVPRFYDVTAGRILVDGHDVRGVTVHSLRRNIGMVLQDSILFSGTIRENILYGKEGATEADMLRAARMAHVDEFAHDMPHGYDTIIGERGITLSGGQKQRVSIARAFLCDPRILILDEATSNLDSRAEAIIQDALRGLMQGRTTLVIAHRLSTIIDCDAVLVLDGGSIAEQGSHAELIRRRGLYRQLCEEQFGNIHLESLSKRAG